jgi:hypothetical protein
LDDQSRTGVVDNAQGQREHVGQRQELGDRREANRRTCKLQTAYIH